MIANLAGIGHHASDKCCGFGWRNRSGQGPSKQGDQDMSKARKTTKQRAKPKITIDCQLKPMDEFIPGLAGLLLSLVDEDLRNERRAAEAADQAGKPNSCYNQAMSPAICHQPKPTPGCRLPRKPTHCPKPSDRGETLADLIHEYKSQIADRQEEDRAQYRKPSNLTDAIKLAAGVVRKVPDHQRRVGRKVLTQACNRLLRHQDEIETCKSFDDLLDLIEQHTADIHRFGTLAVYDTACRLGVYLGLKPKVVYLHAGTAKGAQALGLDTSRGHLEMSELPKPFRLLEPWECEDSLCIYKARLARLKRKS